MTTIDLAQTDRIIDEYQGKPGVLIPVLQQVQAAYGYVPREAVDRIAERMNIFPVEIYGVLTFYTQFRLTPVGKHVIRVCQGTACHVMGGKEILDYLSAKLGINDGETTADGEFSLERVACLGCCGMAPVITIDDNFHGWVTVQGMDEILQKYREEGEAK
jgi:NADH-quinone oxidoreductase subunit E